MKRITSIFFFLLVAVSLSSCFSNQADETFEAIEMEKSNADGSNTSDEPPVGP